MILLTIFTPTYNRAYILPQLYGSLKRQTSRNFEWVICDDGSSDNTEELVSEWIKQSDFSIIFKKQKNQGKHIAINTGAQCANGELFFIVDSDDFLADNAVETITKFWHEQNPDDSVSGIISYRMFHDGRLVGSKLPSDVRRCKLRETGNKYNSVGDKVVIYRTDIIKQYPYPKFDDERFLGESYVYNQIDDKYDMLVLDDKLYYFAYQDDGLSQNFRKLYRENPKGFLALFEQGLKYCTGNKQLIKQYAHIMCLQIRIYGRPNKTNHEHLLLKIAALPLAAGLYFKIFVMKASDVKPFKDSEEQ